MSERNIVFNTHTCEYMPNNYQFVINNDKVFLVDVSYSNGNYYKDLALPNSVSFCPWCGERLVDEDNQLLKFYVADDIFPEEQTSPIINEDMLYGEPAIEASYVGPATSSTANATKYTAEVDAVGKESNGDLYGSIQVPGQNQEVAPPMRKTSFDFSARSRIDG